MDNGNIVPRITIEYYYQDSELIPLLTQLPDRPCYCRSQVIGQLRRDLMPPDRLFRLVGALMIENSLRTSYDLWRPYGTKWSLETENIESEFSR